VGNVALRRRCRDTGPHRGDRRGHSSRQGEERGAMSNQDNRRSPRVWTAEEINQQLDEVAEALIQGFPRICPRVLVRGAVPAPPEAAAGTGAPR
jgi:hypothetical protein